MPLLPPGIQCTDWVAAAPGSRMCNDYSSPGGCSIPSRGVCEEWLRKNPNSPLAKLVPATALVRQGISSTPAQNVQESQRQRSQRSAITGCLESCHLYNPIRVRAHIHRSRCVLFAKSQRARTTTKFVRLDSRPT